MAVGIEEANAGVVELLGVWIRRKLEVEVVVESLVGNGVAGENIVDPANVDFHFGRDEISFKRVKIQVGDRRGTFVAHANSDDLSVEHSVVAQILVVDDETGGLNQVVE